MSSRPAWQHSETSLNKIFKSVWGNQKIHVCLCPIFYYMMPCASFRLCHQEDNYQMCPLDLWTFRIMNQNKPLFSIKLPILGHFIIVTKTRLIDFFLQTLKIISKRTKICLPQTCLHYIYHIHSSENTSSSDLCEGLPFSSRSGM